VAFASVGTGGTGVSSTSTSSFTLTTVTNTINAANNRFAILTIVSDNTSTVDGDNGEVTSVTGGNGTWTKLGEYTNSNGAAAAGVTNSLWMFTPSGTNGTGTVFTINYGSARVDKCASLWVFSKASGQSVRIDTETTVQTSGVDASTNFGSVSFAGLTSQARLYFRGAGKEANTTTANTVSSGFTNITANRSRNNASAVIVRGEFRINTSTGETSNPTLAVSGDTACVFVALEEFTPVVTHDATGTLSAGTGALAGTSQRNASHAATGTLSAGTGALAGSAARVAGTVSHDATGTLAAGAGALSGSANRTRQHAATGTLSAGTGSLAGSANRFRAHPASGTLSGDTGTLAGSANRFRVHPASGSLSGGAGTLNGSANRFRSHPSSGGLSGGTGALTGSASRSSGPVSHDATGGLSGGAGALAGSAARFRAHPASGALSGGAGALSGSASRSGGVVSHAATGTISGGAGLLIGLAQNGILTPGTVTEKTFVKRFLR
jgi:hypothetical protein